MKQRVADLKAENTDYDEVPSHNKTAWKGPMNWIPEAVKFRRQSRKKRTPKRWRVCSCRFSDSLGCGSWNTALYGEVNPFRANAAQIEAANRQSDFYTEFWKEDQRRLYEQYLLDANCTTVDCRKEAFDRSTDDATLSSMCDSNNASAAWFWFTSE
jgi:hypothetical protein